MGDSRRKREVAVIIVDWTAYCMKSTLWLNKSLVNLTVSENFRTTWACLGVVQDKIAIAFFLLRRHLVLKESLNDER